MVQATMLLMLSAVTATPTDAVLVEFTSQSCPPCRSMQPVIARLEQSGVPVRHVDVHREQDLAVRYKIRSTPTYVVIADGREQARLVGVQSLQKLQETLRTATTAELTPTRSVQPPAALQPETRMAAVSGGSEAVPSMSVANAIQTARAATVRLRVHDDTGFGVGTGTIIDTHGEEALVLTCGHLFRENGGKGRIEVELFHAGQIKTVAGQVVDYDADDRDIALVVIKPGIPVQPVAVLPKNETVRTGQAVFSFGCDRGDDPSRRDSRITGVDKYDQNKGASNIEIAGAPIDGRSGGGLFDQQGRLIAVCNAADHQGDVGIYTGPRSIYWQLDRVQLANLYKGGGAPAVAATTTPKTAPAATAAPPTRLASLGGTAAAGTQTAAGSDRQVIVIVREGDQHRMVTFDQPPAELEQLLQNAR
ncbi:trypsin-like peptidase domain-containing protein [Roseimaritima sediminicola]|uniref:trypsin-like peptidase domain-containing protein n=1 Tax=Roseimaritima sediminicola TaxID=2662066 RepID=UPI001F1B9455|nr:trypsin-like peptidase domain-containing protein [Roseimaritima sediminicola]